MKRSVGRAVSTFGRVAIVGLALAAGALALVERAGAQQQPAQQEQVVPQLTPQQQGPQQAMQNPFAVPAQNAPQQGASAGCDKLVTLLTARRDMMTKINEAAKNKQKLDAPTACVLFTELTTNGNEAIKWMAANKEWCSIPDQFITNIKNDNEKMANVRGRACKVAEQMKKNGSQPGGVRCACSALPTASRGS